MLTYIDEYSEKDERSIILKIYSLKNSQTNV